MPDRRPSRRTSGIVIAGCLFSAVLLILLFRTLPFDAATCRAALAQARWLGLVGILLSTALHCWISGEKWRFVTGLTSRGTDLGPGFYLYSALIGLLGQVLPLQIAMVTGRSLALRFHGDVPLRRGAGSTVYDQCFDILVPATLILPTLLAATSVLSLQGAGVLAFVTVTGTGVVLAGFGESALAVLLWPVLNLLPRKGKFRELANSLQRGNALTGRRALATLYALSTLRFANLVFRAWLVAWTLHMDLSWLAILFANCGVTFSLIFAFAPGALGVTEWGWVGMLHLFGANPTEAAHYAILSRLFAVTALLVLNLVHAILLMAYWGLRTRRDEADI